MSSPSVEINRANPGWPDLDASIGRAVNETLIETENSDNPPEVSIVLADNAFVQNLNKTWRGEDKPTNVLSFPQRENGTLGDIVLALETIRREAKEQEKSFEAHLLHLVVHGTLHLLGRDHEEESAAQAMEALEIKILARLGIENPYEA